MQPHQPEIMAENLQMDHQEEEEILLVMESDKNFTDIFNHIYYKI